ncbi:MAG: nucleotide sugar dehydrogenase [Burkholderiales bacterium]
MRISIFGLGYVGAVSAGCLASDDHDVIGVDPNQTKVDLINQARSPIIEKDVGEMIARSAAANRLRATTRPDEAVTSTEISIVCVGTPSQINGNLDLSYVRKVCQEIGAALKRKVDSHVVIIRSSMLPGSMRDVVIPTLEEASGKKAGAGFGVCINPEFLREGTAVWDYYNPPKTVIGESDRRTGDIVAKLYDKMTAPLVRTDIETAEMVKYADNAWHALKVVFANEIGSIAKALGMDGHKVMDIFCQDTKLNLSPYYLKPGFAFGGSCLPKDVRALTYKARSLDLELPTLSSILPSNNLHIERGLRMIMDKGHPRVGILGFSFKAGTDDLRESPLVELIERLIGKGYELRIFDRNVELARLTGANRDFILNHIPHISRLMVATIEDVLQFGETIVIGNGAPEFKDVIGRLREDQVLVDLVRISDGSSAPGRYDGICW